MNFFFKKSAGFSLIELIIVVGISTLVGIAVVSFAQSTMRNNRFIGNTLSADQEALKVLRIMEGELRSAGPSASGGYALSSVGGSDLTLFSDSDGDGVREQIRYYISGSNLQKDVIKPSGNPPLYNGTLYTYKLLQGITATSTNIFTYYGSNYAGTTSALSFPVDPHTVRLVKIAISLTRANQSPVTITTQVSIRSLKDNL